MRAYYTADRARFYADTDEHILGALAQGHSFALEMTQREAWRQQISLMREVLHKFESRPVRQRFMRVPSVFCKAAASRY